MVHDESLGSCTKLTVFQNRFKVLSAFAVADSPAPPPSLAKTEDDDDDEEEDEDACEEGW